MNQNDSFQRMNMGIQRLVEYQLQDETTFNSIYFHN